MRNRDFFFMGIVLILTTLGLTSCLDEPTISQAPIQQAVIRFGNFLPATDSLHITVNGIVIDPSTSMLRSNDLSSYILVHAGEKVIVVKNTAGATVDSETVTISTNSLSTLYVKNDATSGLPVIYAVLEGDAYLSTAPKTGKANFYFINFLAADIMVDVHDTTGGRNIFMTYDLKRDAIKSALNDTNGVNSARNFWVSTARMNDEIGIATQTILPNKNYYVYIIGVTGKTSVVFREFQPAPVIQH